MIPSIGRIVHYTLSETDVEQIREKRQGYPGGNPVSAEQVYPAVIVRTWGDTEESAVQLKVFLDGHDDFWATSRNQGEGAGKWYAPPRVEQKAAPVTPAASSAPAA